jgi:tetratricopeptide (TPR) repeat protein
VQARSTLGIGVAVVAVAGPLLLLPAVVGAIEAGGGGESGIDSSHRYRRCMALAENRPVEGYDTAIAWRQKGGGDPARHCIAAALMRLGQYSAAAAEFEDLATDLTARPSELRASLWGQAGLARLMADQSERAFDALTRAVELRPGNVDFRIDRAIALVAQKRLWEAIDDLNTALEVEPDRAESLVLRASVYRKVGGAALAREDLNRALQIDRENPEALLERGLLSRAANDRNGARRDWLRVVRLAPGTAIAASARELIQSIDLRISGQ